MAEWGRGLVLRGVGLAAACALLLAPSGCGEEEGVSEGATVTAYVAAPLCAEAARELSSGGGNAGDVQVRAICLPPVDRGGRLDLATVAANARRATEDSAAIAYVEQSGPPGRFSKPIVDSASIAWISGISGAKAIQRVLDATEESDPSSLRASVHESLGGS